MLKLEEGTGGTPLRGKSTRTKAIVLLSGGLDSAVLAYLLGSGEKEARIYRHFFDLDDDGYDLHLLSILYGQRHHRELEAAVIIAQELHARHDILDFSILGGLLSGSALTDKRIAAPDGQDAAPTRAVTVVPNRNALFLSLAYAFAIAEQANLVAAGFHRGDHPVHPDCRPPFVRAFETMEQLATEGYAAPGLRLVAPFLEMGKERIVQLGEHLGVPLDQTWSCYEGGEQHCGRCGTCVERQEAFALAHMYDPTNYREPRA